MTRSLTTVRRHMRRRDLNAEIMIDMIEQQVDADFKSRCSANVLAEEFCVSPRTLFRRLHGAGLTFRELMDDYKARLAKRALEREDVSIRELAHQVGYANSSNFTKAFKRWTGCTPAHYRALSRGITPEETVSG